MSAARIPDPMLPVPWRVRSVRHEIADVMTLDLVPLSGEAPAFAPGQFNMLYAFGIGEIPISLSGDAADRSRYVHTVRAVGAVSAAIVRAETGGIIGLRGPFGSSWPVDDAEGHDILIVAGGLGLAPLRPAIYHVLANSQRFGRIALLYGSRGPADILFHDELAAWRSRLDIGVSVTVDHADRSWHGDVGVVPTLIDRIPFDLHNTVAFVCGPEVMMRFSAKALQANGVALERIYLSMERNMKCALGLCGHCQFGPDFVCKDGPVLRCDRIAQRLATREI
jgi:NAD(P)H-flavin reductase